MTNGSLVSPVYGRRPGAARADTDLAR